MKVEAKIAVETAAPVAGREGSGEGWFGEVLGRFVQGHAAASSDEPSNEDAVPDAVDAAVTGSHAEGETSIVMPSPVVAVSPERVPEVAPVVADWPVIVEHEGAREPADVHPPATAEEAAVPVNERGADDPPILDRVRGEAAREVSVAADATHTAAAVVTEAARSLTSDAPATGSTLAADSHCTESTSADQPLARTSVAEPASSRTTATPRERTSPATPPVEIDVAPSTAPASTGETRAHAIAGVPAVAHEIELSAPIDSAAPTTIVAIETASRVDGIAPADPRVPDTNVADPAPIADTETPRVADPELQQRVEKVRAALEQLRPIPDGGVAVDVDLDGIGRIELRVEPVDGGLRVSLGTDEPTALARLEAQRSELELALRHPGEGLTLDIHAHGRRARTPRPPAPSRDPEHTPRRADPIAPRRPGRGLVDVVA